MSGIMRIAHRGASGDGHAPENTLPAFQKAIEIGVDAVECDVHCTKDDQVVVIHDHTLSRTTDSRGAVEDMNLSEIKKADAGAWFDPRFAGLRVPTLQEVLEVTKGKVITVIEIKRPNIADKVIKAIKDADSETEVVAISFHSEALRDMQQLAPHIPRALLVGGKIVTLRLPSMMADLIQKAVKVGAGTLDLSIRAVTPQLVQESHKRGISVWAWTVDDEAEMLKLAEMGVDGITSNYPDRLQAVFPE